MLFVVIMGLNVNATSFVWLLSLHLLHVYMSDMHSIHFVPTDTQIARLLMCECAYSIHALADVYDGFIFFGEPQIKLKAGHIYNARNPVDNNSHTHTQHRGSKSMRFELERIKQQMHENKSVGQSGAM